MSISLLISSMTLNKRQSSIKRVSIRLIDLHIAELKVTLIERGSVRIVGHRIERIPIVVSLHWSADRHVLVICLDIRLPDLVSLRTPSAKLILIVCVKTACIKDKRLTILEISRGIPVLQIPMHKTGFNFSPSCLKGRSNRGMTF